MENFEIHGYYRQEHTRGGMYDQGIAVRGISYRNFLMGFFLKED
jgi:hypothetical protein